MRSESVCFDRNGFHRVIGGAQLDGRAFTVIRFDRGIIIDDRNHRLAVPSRTLFLNDDEVAGENPLIPHRLAFHS